MDIDEDKPSIKDEDMLDDEKKDERKTVQKEKEGREL